MAIGNRALGLDDDLAYAVVSVVPGYMPDAKAFRSSATPTRMGTERGTGVVVGLDSPHDGRPDEVNEGAFFNPEQPSRPGPDGERNRRARSLTLTAPQ